MVCQKAVPKEQLKAILDRLVEMGVIKTFLDIPDIIRDFGNEEWEVVETRYL